MLRHSNIREFMCDACGRQFKRKDKLKEHVKRVHNGKTDTMKAETTAMATTSAMTANGQYDIVLNIDQGDEVIETSFDLEAKHRKKAFVPKVPPTDLERFIYKCHQCHIGFKRRGMLVNHLAKRHPEQKPESVPELTLPILKTQREFYCQYCDKVKEFIVMKAELLRYWTPKQGVRGSIPNPLVMCKCLGQALNPHPLCPRQQ